MRTQTAALQSDINVTPLVDVCLVLLIIFMVVTPLLVTAIPVRLPQASTVEGLAKHPMQITVNADGTIYLDATVIRAEQLSSELAGRRDQLLRPVVVRADKTLPYGKVIGVLDACRSAGFEKVGLAADSKPGGAPRAR